MRETISGPDALPMSTLGSVARALNFADATPAVHHRPKAEAVTAHSPSARPNVFADALAGPDKKPSSDAASDSSAIRVVLRVRPLSEQEQKHDSRSCVSRSENCERTAKIHPAKPAMHPVAVRNAGFARFKFAKIFDESSSQSDVFEQTALSMIEGLFQGHSAVVFAHGVTCSGKTWTIQGSDEQPGILPRSLDVIVNSIAVAKGKGLLQESSVSESVEKLTSGRTDAGGRRTRTRMGKNAKAKTHDSNYIVVDGNVEYKIFASYLEVYNEQCYDLFETSGDSEGTECQQPATSHHSESSIRAEPSTGAKSEGHNEHQNSRARTRRRILKLKMNHEKEIYAEGITEIEISNCADIDRLLEYGQRNRTVAHTKANEVSSRSHAVFFITLKMTEIQKQSNGRTITMRSTAKLSIVDLAGSERTSRENNSGEGVRQKETNKINSSLMNLGRCLQVMRRNQRVRRADPSKKLDLVPFRQSRLTHLLQHSLESGSAIMIANVSPTMNDSDVTIQALRCAAIAQEVTLAPSRKAKKSILSDRTNLMGSNIPSRIPYGKKVLKSTLRRPPRSLRSKDLTNRDMTICNSNSKTRANEYDTIVANQKKEIAFLTMEVEEERCGNLEHERVRLQLEEEIDRLFRQNERLKDRLADSEARLCVVETEVREELTEGTEQMLKRVQEHYQKQVDDLQQELDSSRASTGTRGRVSIVSCAEHKVEAQALAARLARRASKAAFDGIKMSLADCTQVSEDEEGSSGEWESDVGEYVEEGEDDVDNYIEESA